MAGARSTVNDYTDAQVTEAGAVKVYVRLRPPDGAATVPARYYKLDEDQPSRMTIKSSPTSQHLFAFNRVYGPAASQEEVFTETSQRLCDHVLEGYNSCCFAYGQTGSGKTYTMFGSEKGDAPGLIPRAVDYIFRVLKTRSHAKDTAVVISFLEVYMDRVRDLGIASAEGGHVAEGAEAGETARRPPPRPDSALRTARPDTTSGTTKWFEEAGKVTGTFGRRAGSDASMDYGARYAKQSLDVREDAAGNVYVEGLTVLSVANAEQALEVVRRGMGLRATHDTRMNAVSSRSHTVLTLHVLQKDRRTGQTIDGMLNLVDLAGSERLKRSESEGMRQAEARFINSSLTALGKVVIALQGQTLTAAGPAAVAADPSMRGTTADGGHVPYRDSKLTRLLQNSLGGNSFTVLLATVHPRGEDVEESLSSLQFAHRCRSVINRPKVNVTLRDDEDKDRRIRQLEGANAMLRRQLAVTRVTTRLRIMRLMADVGASGVILSDGRFRLSDGRVLGLTLRQAMRSQWARKAIAAALAPGGPYSSEGVARAAASAASAAAGGGDGAAAAAARADDMLSREMVEPDGVAPLEARHALEVPPMTAEERAEAEKEEAGLAADSLASQQLRMKGGTGGPASAAGAGEAMLPRHRAAGGGAEAEAFRALAAGGVAWDDASRGRSGAAGAANGFFAGGGASGRMGASTASGAGGTHSDEVVTELKARVAELSKQLQKEQARTASEAGTLRGLAKDQRERAAEARAVAETSTRAARDEVERTSSSYARQVASLMAQSQSLLHHQHELVAAVPKSLRVAESALHEAAAVEERVREEEAALRRQAVANAQQASRRELAQAAQSHKQTTRALAEDSARMAAEFRAWSARAREREVGLESEVRSIWEYAAGLGQVVRELEEGRFAVEVSAAGRRVFRVPPQLLPQDPFEAHPTSLPHLRRLLEREAIDTGHLTPDERAEDLGATSGSGSGLGTTAAGTVRGGVTGGTGRSSRGGRASLKTLPRGLRKPPARPAGSSPDPTSDAESRARSLDAGLRGRAPAARPPAGGVHQPRPELDGMAGAASLTRSVRAGGAGGQASAWSSKRRSGSLRRGGKGPGTGYAAASALQEAVRARGRGGSAGGAAGGAYPDVTGGVAEDSGEDDGPATDSGLELPEDDGRAEGKDGSAGSAAVRSASREKRLQRLERELDARAQRGDVDLEADPASMEPELLRAHVNALRRYIESGLRRRVEEEIVNDLAEQPSIDYVRTLEQQRDAARGRLEEEVVKARDLQIAYNALRRQLDRAGRATLVAGVPASARHDAEHGAHSVPAVAADAMGSALTDDASLKEMRHPVAEYYRDQNKTIKRAMLRQRRGMPWAVDLGESVDSEDEDEALGDSRPAESAETIQARRKASERWHVQAAINLSFAANVLIFVIKLAAGIMSGSLALISSAIESGLDLLSGSIIFVTAVVQKRKRPHKYPVGRTRLEPVSLVVFSSVMGMAALILLQEGATALVNGFATAPAALVIDGWTWASLGLSIGLKFALLLYCGSVKESSASVGALAADHRNDVLTTTATLIAILFAFYIDGAWWLDSVMAMLLALYILVNWAFEGLEQVKGLTGRGANREQVADLIRVAMTHSPKICFVDTVRAYYAGLRLMVEIDIVLPPDMPLHEAHDVGQSLQLKVERFESVERCFVHLDHSVEDPRDEHIHPDQPKPQGLSHREGSISPSPAGQAAWHAPTGAAAAAGFAAELAEAMEGAASEQDDEEAQRSLEARPAAAEDAAPTSEVTPEPAPEPEAGAATSLDDVNPTSE